MQVLALLDTSSDLDPFAWQTALIRVEKNLLWGE